MSVQETAVIIQGPKRLPPRILDTAWSKVSVIWSTWKQEPPVATHNPVVLNEAPVETGVANLGMQVVSTLGGLTVAKFLGYKYALKWRSDQIPTSAEKLMSLFDYSKINVMYWCNCDGGYYLDYFMLGNIDDMISIWDIKDVNAYGYPEMAITEKLSKYSVNCIGDGITTSNDIYWFKGDGIPLSTYKPTGNFQVKNK